MISPTVGCGPQETLPGSPSRPRGRRGGLCTRQAYLGSFSGPAAEVTQQLGTLCHACCELCARESEDDPSTSTTSCETVPAAEASVPTVNGAVWGILAHQHRSLTSERPLYRQQPTTM